MTPSDKLLAQKAREYFTLTVRQPDGAIDLGHAALLVAAEEEPRCDVARCRALLYEMGMEARARLAVRTDEPITALNHFVFDELGFKGNQSDYYDARNSLLNQVLERRTGIPITLSVVYMEIGRRAGLHVEGIGMPGHFVVRVSAGDEQERAGRGVLVDPFHGTMIDEDECQQRLDAMYGGQVPLTDEHLRAVSTRQILARLLRNLKAVYVQAEMFVRALAVVERVMLLEPHALEERRDRAMLLAQLGRDYEAFSEMRIYVGLAPDAPDAEQSREQLKKLQIRLAALN